MLAERLREAPERAVVAGILHKILNVRVRPWFSLPWTLIPCVTEVSAPTQPQPAARIMARYLQLMSRPC